MRILIAEDDLNILNGLAEVLEDEGYDTLKARNGSEAVALFTSQSPDFVCLDIMMPGMSGYDVCREIRAHSTEIPIIFISAKSEEIDKVIGLELGADDYIAKPFGIREIVARVRAVTRRCLAASRPAQQSQTPFCMGDLQILPDELRAHRGEQVIELSLRDINILRILHDRRGSVVDRSTLFSQAWGIDHIPNSRTLDQHISQLRKRVELDPKDPQIITTIHGIGYRYDS